MRDFHRPHEGPARVRTTDCGRTWVLRDRPGRRSIGLKVAFGGFHIRRLGFELMPGHGRGLFYRRDDPVNRKVNRKIQRLFFFFFFFLNT
jgi:hypothetical protein